MIALYWFVQPTKDEKLVNMAIKQINGLPCLVNTKKVTNDTELLRSPHTHVVEKEKEEAAKREAAIKRATCSDAGEGQGKLKKQQQ